MGRANEKYRSLMAWLAVAVLCPAAALAQQPPAGPPAPPAQPAAPQPPEPSLSPEQSSATGTESIAVAAPNIIGDLLYGSHSITFHYLRTAGGINVAGNGLTSII